MKRVRDCGANDGLATSLPIEASGLTVRRCMFAKQDRIESNRIESNRMNAFSPCNCKLSSEGNGAMHQCINGSNLGGIFGCWWWCLTKRSKRLGFGW